jgi:hypothetical protein
MRDEKEKEYSVQGFCTGFTVQVFFLFLHSGQRERGKERDLWVWKQVEEGNSFSRRLSREMGSHE